MSQSTNRLFQAFELLQVAIAEVQEAQLAIADEEFTQDLPSVLVCSYEPLQQKGHFALLGTVHHVAGTLEHSLAAPENFPFRSALLQAMENRLFS